MTLVGSTASGDITAGWLVDMTDTIVSAQSLLPANPAALRQVISGSVKTRPGIAFAAAERGQPSFADLNGVPVRVRREASGLLVAEDMPDLSELRSAVGLESDKQTLVGHARRYRKEARHWVLVDDVSEIDSDDANGKRHHHVVTSLRNVHYFLNPAKDSLRRIARPTTDWIPLPQSSSPAVGTGTASGMLRSTIPAPAVSSSAASATGFSGPTAASGGPRHYVACDESCQSGGYVAPNAYPVALGSPPPCGDDNVAFTVADPANADVNILFQHGFKSKATTWCQGSEYLRARFRVGYELRHTLAWRASYEDQAADLNSRFQADLVDRPGSYVLVGHSNGGRVNRYMAQSRNGADVRAVVTLSSPHAGSYLANLDQTVLAAAVGVPLAYALSGCDLSTTFVCSNLGQFGAQVLAVAGPLLLQAAIPVSKQMGTDATFAQIINSRGDPNYRTAGVQNRLWDRWTAWRLVGDNLNCDAYSLIDCDAISSSYVRVADRNYHGFIKCSVVSGLFGIVWPGARSAARACAINAGKMRAVDFAYKRLSVGSDHGDGIVHEGSQLYPGSRVQILNDDSNSHIGETRSRKSANAIATAIAQAANVPIFQ